MRRTLARMMQWGATTLVLGLAPALAADLLVLPPTSQPQLSSVLPVAKHRPLFQHATYPVAWTAAQKSNRPILVFVSMPNCPHCVKMVEQTYRIPQVEQLVAGSFETVKAGRYSHAKLVSKLHIKWYPTTVLVGPNNKVLDVIEGYVDAKQFQQRLQTGLAVLHKPAATQTR